MPIFEYGQREIDYLKSKDKKLAAAIDRIGRIHRSVNPDLFSALISSIVAQQISSKAAETVWNRLEQLLISVTPDSIVNKTQEEIQSCGMTMKKAMYIKGIAEEVLYGRLNIHEFSHLSDVEVVKRLSALNGIGTWTAEMLMIFSMQRPDVVSWGDLAIRRGMMMLYHHKELSKERFER